MSSAMLLVEDRDRSIFSSNPQCGGIGIDEKYLYLEPEESTQTMLRLVPVHPFGPPECCYYTEVSQEGGVYIHRCGKGMAVTIPWYPGEFYARTGFGSLSLFMRDVLTNLCGAVSIAPELTEMVEVSLSANAAGDRLVQLVNNSGTFGVSFVKPLPVETINVTIPTEEAPSQVCTLNGGTVRWQFSDHLLTLTLDRLDEYDAILIRR